ncbi:MAG: glycoside hydrolase family 65 protein, partial [Acholeplasmataceae bacterium]
MHRLSADLYTENGWNVVKTGDDPDQAITDGTNFMVGNGYLGYRATLARDRKEGYAGCIVSDTWDKADGKWEELSTVPNALYLSIGETSRREMVRTLDLKRAVTKHAYQADVSGVLVRVEEEKFASITEHHVVMMRFTLLSDAPLKLDLITGIDEDVWSLNGVHLKDLESFDVGDDSGIKARTVEKNDRIVVLERLGIKSYRSVTPYKEAGITGRRFGVELEAFQPFVIEKAMIVVTSNDTKDPLKKAVDLHDRLKGYEEVLREHVRTWEDNWKRYDIRLGGPIRDQVALRFNAYHAVIATPTDRPLPIGARGMSCQAYQGAAFWDQEIYNMPMFLHTDPRIARNILRYRYLTLPGAKRKAKKHGYEGAFYAWISGKTGDELCPDFFFKDVITQRDIRNHFNLWQIHISPDIAYAIDHYYRATKDREFMLQYGIEMMVEIARFIASRVVYLPRRGRYEILRVQGPDEYHENIDNNAFTNY